MTAVQGGASGAIIVGGIANLQPAVAGLPERVLIVRDQPVAGAPTPGGIIPSWDVSLNYVPIPYVATPTPGFISSVIQMKTGAREFWRVSNSSADTIFSMCNSCTTASRSRSRSWPWTVCLWARRTAPQPVILSAKRIF